MIHGIIEWWADMSRRSKYLFCLIVMGINVVMLMNGRVWFAGWAIGAVLLFCTLFKVGENWD